MKKIASLFKRHYEGTRKVYDEVVEGSEWVLQGGGVATRKWDGTCCLVRDGDLLKRHDRKLTKKRNRELRNKDGAMIVPASASDFKPAPPGWEAAEPEPNVNTGHWPGWQPVTGDDPASKWHWAAWQACADLHDVMQDGTYELVGPHFQGNPEGWSHDGFSLHGFVKVDPCPRSFDALRVFLDGGGIEGIVWHHEDGRMVKIKARDFDGVSR